MVTVVTATSNYFTLFQCSNKIELRQLNHHLYLVLVLLQIHMVYNKENGKPRGYAFIEYEHERDMHCEYLTFM